MNTIHKQKRSINEIILIAVGILFVAFMLVLPLLSVIVNALKEGFVFYLNALSTKYQRLKTKGWRKIYQPNGEQK